MSNSPSSEHLHRLVLLYLTVAYAEGPDLDPREEAAIVALIRRWVPGLSEPQVRSVVATALTAYRSRADHDVDALAVSLATWLSRREQRALLTDLGRVARADGVLSVEEAETIRRIRSAWSRRPNRQAA